MKKKTSKTLFATLLAITLIFSQITLVYANEEFSQGQVIVKDESTGTEDEADMLRAGSSSKDARGYFAPTGTVPDLGLVVAWGIDITVHGYYTIGSTSHTLDKIWVTGSMTPRQTNAAGDGVVTFSVTETIDSGSSTVRKETSSFWSHQTAIWDGRTYVYFSEYGNPNKQFRYDAKEVLHASFANSAAMLHGNNSGTLTLTISGPK